MIKWLAVAACLVGCSAFAESLDLNRNFQLHTGAEIVRFNPTKDADLRRLQAQIEKSLQTREDDSKHSQRGLEEIERLAGAALSQSNSVERGQLELELVETALAVNNLDRPPIPDHFDFIMVPMALQQLHRPVGVGRKPADDLAPGDSTDLSLRDPSPSSFWKRPANIPAEDLRNGFGRTSFSNIVTGICHYAAPKETTGMNPGYEVDCAGERVKLKFGEQSSEPLVTRMFWALGFNADPTDYSPGVKVAYDRRIFTEFNSRKPVHTTFTVFWFIPIYTMNLQRQRDPFDFVASAVLRDGTKWSGPELKRHLMDGTNFQSAVEAQINYIVTTPANVQVKDSQVKSIGPWDYAQLDHANRREIRGAGLLAAWLGFYDTRFDNTRLRLVGPKKHQHLEHYFSDLGGGMGRSSGFLSWHGEDVNAFAWTFTEPSWDPKRAGQFQRLHIVGYTPVVPNAAFAAMTVDDARWMARLIGQLRPEQIKDALIASGYDDATAGLYLRKLLNRRNKMMGDLGLSADFPTLTIADIN